MSKSGPIGEIRIPDRLEPCSNLSDGVRCKSATEGKTCFKGLPGIILTVTEFRIISRSKEAVINPDIVVKKNINRERVSLPLPSVEIGVGEDEPVLSLTFQRVNSCTEEKSSDRMIRCDASN